MSSKAGQVARATGRLGGIGKTGLGLVAMLALAACSMGDFSFGPAGGGGSTQATASRSFGNGPVQVSLLLPLSGDPNLAAVGTSLANASALAIDFVEANPNIAENITITLRDTGSTAAGATQAAQAALSDGASLILGPLRADQVSAAGQVARAAGVSVIGFSNNSGAAGPGVFLLNVLPETEVRRSMGYAQKQGRKAYAALLPTSDFGRIQEGAFRQAMADLGLTARAVYSFGSEAEARSVVSQLVPLLQQGQIDTLFIPDRASAPNIANLLAQAGIAPNAVQYVGSADWDGDPAILATAALSGAIYPAVDDAGYRAMLPEYQQKFGSAPHKLATIAYTATILANAGSLSNATPKYDRALLTAPAGFNGRDGVFRFSSDGRSQYALVIRRVASGGSTVAEAAKL